MRSALEPTFDQYHPQCITIVGSKEQKDKWLALDRKRSKMIEWDELVDVSTIRYVRIFSDDDQKALPALLHYEGLRIEELSIQSQFLPFLADAPCAPYISRYIGVVGSGSPTALPEIKFPQLTHLWVAGSRTPIKFRASQLPSLKSAQLCYGRSNASARPLEDLLPQLQLAGLWGVSEQHFRRLPSPAPNITHLRIISSNITNADFLQKFPNVESIFFDSCSKLTDISMLHRMGKLTKVSFWWCTRITSSMKLFRGAPFAVDYAGSSQN